MITFMGELQEWEALFLKELYRYLVNQGSNCATPIPPNMREIMPALGIGSTATLDSQIKKLARRGFLVDDPAWKGRSRASMRLTTLGKSIAEELYYREKLK